MKRKLPQWLLDVTNNNDKSAKHNPTESIQKQSEQQSNNGAISVVPLANLLLPSHGGAAQVNESHTNLSNETELPKTTSTESTNGIMPRPVVIKTEIPDPTAATASNATNEQQVVVKTEIKGEPMDTGNVTNVPPPAPPSTLVPKVEDVKQERRSCNYGIKCFRRNPDHRSELAHPGDVDYRRPDLPNAVAGTPPCPWGAACYRRNPQHFIQLSHPPANIYNPTANTTTTATVNPVPQSNPPQRRNRNGAGNNRIVHDNDGSDADDDYDLEDPFIDDGSSDEYVPDGDGDDDDDEDDMEDSQVTDS